MKLLGRYVVKRLGIMSLYALLALLGLYGFFDVLAEVGSMGKGGYTGVHIVQYVLLKVPAHAHQLMPLAVLMGGMVALSQLSANSELAVIRASGVSTAQIIGMLMRFGLVFALMTVVLGEWIAPQLSRQADVLKSVAKSGNVSLSHSGVWIKQPNGVVHVASMLPDGTLEGVKIWRYNNDFELVEAIQARRAQVQTGQWRLQEARSSVLTDKAVTMGASQERMWPSTVGVSLLNVLLVKPEQMSLWALGDYIAYLRANHQQTLVYDVAWWHKLMYPLAVLVMTLVALAFTPIGARHSNMGLKLFAGIGLGLVFFFAGRLFGFTAQLYGVPAFVAAVLPTVGFAVWAVYSIHRQARR